jgi:acetyl esterase/lipase
MSCGGKLPGLTQFFCHLSPALTLFRAFVLGNPPATITEQKEKCLRDQGQKLQALLQEVNAHGTLHLVTALKHQHQNLPPENKYGIGKSLTAKRKKTHNRQHSFSKYPD